MAQYLKLFKTEADYEAVVGTDNEPTVSHIVEDVNVIIKEPEWVDLGLPSGTLWRKYNIGATKETEVGNYYQYGKGSRTYQETSGETLYQGTENPLAASADTAIQTLGGEWHMPTAAQCEELTANTTIEYNVYVDGVKCIKLTAPNGNFLLFPPTGMYFNGIKQYQGNSVCWTSTFAWTYSQGNFAKSFYASDMGSTRVDHGLTVRPVIG